MKKPVLYIVIACYNEEEVFPLTKGLFQKKIEDLSNKGKVSSESKIFLIDDGSKDKTWELIKEESKRNSYFLGISQSKNRGQQSCFLAGFNEVKDKCDIVVTTDIDGQDDLDAIDLMVDEYLSGSEVVYGVRNDRKTDSFFKRTTGQLFYKITNKLGGNLVYNHSEYRLMSSKVLKSFADYTEVNMFIRGLIPLIGYKSSNVYYKRNKRIAGKTNYSFKSLMNLAVDGITDVSVIPLRFSTYFGLIVALISFGLIIWSIVMKFTNNSISGWASTISIISFIGGIQLLSLGIIGEYIGKIYLETKKRPRYIISEKTYQETIKDESDE